jgi:hypothetical protein
MGIQDRDWYRDEMRARREAEKKQAGKRTATPGQRRKPIPVDLLENANPPKLWGSGWHWSIQLLVWLSIVVLLLVIWRIVR